MSKTKQRLGKGLGALLPDIDSDKTSTETNSGQVKNLKYLDPRLIKANPFQPRTEFDAKALNDLKQSIKENGVIQPLLVRLTDDEFELVAGERRLRSVLDLGHTEVPVLIKEIKSDEEMLQIALIENIQREDLNIIELATSYKRLIDECNLTIEELAGKIGKDRSTINNILRLLKLPTEILTMLKENLLSGGHGRALLSLEKKSDQTTIAKNAVKNAWSVRQVEAIVKKIGSESSEKSEKTKIKNPHYNKLEEQLMHRLGTKVSISPKKKGGLIEVHYYNEDDLERISELIDRLS